MRLRIFDKVSNKYINDEVFFDVNGDGYFLADLPFSDSVGRTFKKEEIIVEKSTFKFDIKGNEIFEGDIVNEIFNNEFSFVDTFKKEKLKSIVKQDTCNPTLVLHRNNVQNKYDWEYDFSKTDLLKLEVIGNIHENSDLLTQS